MQPKCLSNFGTIGQFQIQISPLPDIPRPYKKTSYRKLKKGPGDICTIPYIHIHRYLLISYRLSAYRLTAPKLPTFATHVLNRKIVHCGKRNWGIVGFLTGLLASSSRNVPVSVAERAWSHAIDNMSRDTCSGFVMLLVCFFYCC